METDEHWMGLALREARRGVGRTSPNPAVGAVIVSRAGRLLAKGWHRGAGQPHAEVEALGRLARPGLARGATMYVTLEPCSTHGRTGPCTEAILRAGLKRVVVAATDPNPAHKGRGLRLLRKGGLEVRAGVLEEEARALNRGFEKWIVTGMPLVVAKWAMSLDGRITRRAAEGRWLTGEKARKDVQRLRAQVDAILVGAGTVRADDPRLTVRGRRVLRQPWRVVVTRSGRLPAGARLLTDEHRERTLIYKGLPLREVLRELGRREVTSVLIEGGAEVLGEAFAEGLVDRVRVYVAGLVAGGGLPALGRREMGRVRVRNPVWRRVGGELVLEGDVAGKIQV